MEAFLAVVDHGTFRAAAEARSVTQPALTKQIQALERAVGTRLLERSRHGAVPTPAGRALLAHARTAVEAAAGFREHARRVGSGDTGFVSVGFGMSGLRRVPAVVERFRRLAPEVRVSVEDLSSDAQHQRIADGRLDVGFGRAPSRPDVAFAPLWSDRLAVATTEQDVRPDALPGWLDRRPVIRLAPSKGPGLSAQIDRLERHWRIRPGTLTVTHDLLTVIAMAQAGIGPAVIPHSAAHLARPPLRVIAVDEPAAAWAVGAAWRPATLGPAAGRLLRLARELAGQADSSP